MKAILAMFFSLTVLISVPVFAGTSVDAKIVQVRVDRDGIGMIFFDKPVGGGSPACINLYYNNALSFNSNTSGGKSQLSVALAAKAMGVNVVAYGLGSCTNYGGAHVEDLDYLVSR